MEQNTYNCRIARMTNTQVRQTMDQKSKFLDKCKDEKEHQYVREQKFLQRQLRDLARDHVDSKRDLAEVKQVLADIEHAELESSGAPYPPNAGLAQQCRKGVQRLIEMKRKPARRPGVCEHEMLRPLVAECDETRRSSVGHPEVTRTQMTRLENLSRAARPHHSHTAAFQPPKTQQKQHSQHSETSQGSSQYGKDTSVSQHKISSRQSINTESSHGSGSESSSSTNVPDVKQDGSFTKIKRGSWYANPAPKRSQADELKAEEKEKARRMSKGNKTSESKVADKGSTPWNPNTRPSGNNLGKGSSTVVRRAPQPALGDEATRHEPVDAEMLQRYHDLLVANQHLLMEDDPNFELPSEALSTLNTAKRSQHRKKLALESLLKQLPSFKKKEPIMDSYSALQCRYLRLTPSTVEELESLCQQEGRDAGLHAHMGEEQVIRHFDQLDHQDQDQDLEQQDSTL